MRERILALLSERPLTIRHLEKALGLKPSQGAELSRELTLMHRERLVRTEGGRWTINETEHFLASPNANRLMESMVEVKPRKKPERIARNPASDVGRPLGAKSRAVIAALSEGPRTPKYLATRLGQTDNAIYKRLHELAQRGHISRLAYGLYALHAATLCHTCNGEGILYEHGGGA